MYCNHVLKKKKRFRLILVIVIIHSKNSNLKLNVTYKIIVISPDRETFSMSFPSIINSSFCLELVTVTPGDILTRLMNFSPKKFLISIRELLSEVTQLMGKWAYTALILYKKP